MTTEIQVVQPTIPSDLLLCDVPAPTLISTEADAAAYVTQLHQAALACAAQVSAIQRIVAPHYALGRTP